MDIQKIREVGEYFRDEWRVIASAPVSFGVIVVLIIGITYWGIGKFYGERIATLEATVRLYEARVSQVVSGLEEREEITRLQEGNTIVLQHDPLSESLRLIVNGIIYFPQVESGMRVNGREIILEDLGDWKPLSIVKDSIPSHGVFVLYHKKD